MGSKLQVYSAFIIFFVCILASLSISKNDEAKLFALQFADATMCLVTAGAAPTAPTALIFI